MFNDHNGSKLAINKRKSAQNLKIFNKTFLNNTQVKDSREIKKYLKLNENEKKIFMQILGCSEIAAWRSYDIKHTYKKRRKN